MIPTTGLTVRFPSFSACRRHRYARFLSVSIYSGAHLMVAVDEQSTKMRGEIFLWEDEGDRVGTVDLDVLVRVWSFRLGMLV